MKEKWRNIWYDDEPSVKHGEVDQPKDEGDYRGEPFNAFYDGLVLVDLFGITWFENEWLEVCIICMECGNQAWSNCVCEEPPLDENALN